MALAQSTAPAPDWKSETSNSKHQVPYGIQSSCGSSRPIQGLDAALAGILVLGLSIPQPGVKRAGHFTPPILVFWLPRNSVIDLMYYHKPLILLKLAKFIFHCLQQRILIHVHLLWVLPYIDFMERSDVNVHYFTPLGPSEKNKLIGQVKLLHFGAALIHLKVHSLIW